MSNLTKLEFVAFDISGKNYLTWILDAKIHLEVNEMISERGMDAPEAAPYKNSL